MFLNASESIESLKASFIKSHAASFLATGVDYCITVLAVEALNAWYVLGTALGAISGAVVHFLAGRYWAFASKERHIVSQGFRYALVAAGSFFLNVGGVYFLTELALLHYLVSKVIVAVLVGVGFNFTMHRLFVFK